MFSQRAPKARGILLLVCRSIIGLASAAYVGAVGRRGGFIAGRIPSFRFLLERATLSVLQCAVGITDFSGVSRTHEASRLF
jgi:hypothetical protein